MTIVLFFVGMTVFHGREREPAWKAGASIEDRETGMEAEICVEGNGRVRRSMEGWESVSFLFTYAPAFAVMLVG